MRPFSVVIPLYNKRETIGRCLASVEANNPELIEEIIVVNDGSTDFGEKVVEQKATHDARIKLIDQANRGVSVARNVGIQASRCEHVLLLDADDEWKPGFASTIAGLVARCPEAILFATAFKVIRADGTEVLPKLRFVPTNSEGGYIADFVKCISTADPPLYSSCVALNRTAFGKGGGFPVDVAHGEDRIFWLRLAEKGPFAWSPRIECLRHECRNNNSADTWTPSKGQHYLNEIKRRLAECSDVEGQENLRRLYDKELGHVGRESARTRHYSAALKTAGCLVTSRRIGLAGQIISILLIPNSLYRYIKTTLK